MFLKKTLVSGWFLAVLAVTAATQEPQQPGSVPEAENPNSSTKVDEFGRVGECDFGARIDNLMIQLQDRPDATAYVITYKAADTLPGERDNDRIATRTRNHINMRGFDPSRVVIIPGGFREEIATELFIVPSGSPAPEPTDNIEPHDIPEGTFLWSQREIRTERDFEEYTLEEFVLPEVTKRREDERRLQEMEWEIERAEQTARDIDVVPVDAEELLEDGLGIEGGEFLEDDAEDEQVDERSPEELREARFLWIDKRFAVQVASRNSAGGVIIFYADDEEFDIAGLRRFVEEGRDKIALEANIDTSLIEVVFGGYKHSPSAQFFIVAEDGDDPEAEPDDRPAAEEDEQSKFELAEASEPELKQPNENIAASQRVVD